MLVLLFVGCIPCKEVSTTIIERDTIEVVRDSTIVMPGDSAWFRALLECDSMNNILMREFEMQQGSTVKQKVKFLDRYIYVVAEVDSNAIYIQWKELHTSNKEYKLEVTTEYVKVYPKWLVITAFAGAMLFITVLIYIIIKLKTRK